jgi:hypothetical protein
MTRESAPSSGDGLSWEVVEVCAAGLLAAAAAISTLAVASGIVYGLTTDLQVQGAPVDEPFGNPPEVGPSIAQIVQHSTGWASPVLAIVVLGAIGTLWWSVDSWNSFVDDESSEVSEQGYETAFRHLLRAKGMLNVTLAVLVALAAADIALVVSTFVTTSGFQGGFVASQDLAISGEGLCTLVIVGVGMFVAIRSRNRVLLTFDEAVDEEGDDTIDDAS